MELVTYLRRAGLIKWNRGHTKISGDLLHTLQRSSLQWAVVLYQQNRPYYLQKLRG